MSLDFQLAWQCPHLTVEEHVTIGPDLRSLPTSQPVGNSGSVRMLVNDEVFIPQGGLYVGAILTAATSGPYQITPGQDTITVTTPVGTSTYTFGFKAVTRLSATDIIGYLQRAKFSVAIPAVVNGHLAFQEYSQVGALSYVSISGSATTALGFGDGLNGYQQRAQGRCLYPGWRVVQAPGTITGRYPIFNTPVKRGSPVFKLTYSVPSQRCLRCGASLIENDIRFDPNGQMLTVTDENLLYQAALKILLTVRGSNPYHPAYGSEMMSRIGSKAIAGIASMINSDVRQALARLQTLQAQQAKYQQVSFAERLYTIQSVNVTQHTQDPTIFQVYVSVRNASSQPINLTVVFAVPGAVALMGSNGLFLGTEQLSGPQPAPPTITAGLN